jgi:hypothetical protein
MSMIGYEFINLFSITDKNSFSCKCLFNELYYYLDLDIFDSHLWKRFGQYLKDGFSAFFSNLISNGFFIYLFIYLFIFIK